MSKMEGLFRIDADTLNAGGFAPDVLNMALHWGILVPVQKCKHGNVYPHMVTMHTGLFARSYYSETCEGAGLETDE
jgi:hypothetical protein